jgi:glucose-1-phosphate thymidylyltransferase
MPDASAERLFDTKIQGAVRIHPSAEIISSVIRGPALIGPGVRIRSSYVGPYTSIGEAVVLDCVEIEDSIVLDRAQIRFLETRVESSVVGPGACVSRDFELPRALRLTIGADAQVALA